MQQYNNYFLLIVILHNLLNIAKCIINPELGLRTVIQPPFGFAQLSSSLPPPTLRTDAMCHPRDYE